MGIFEPNQLEIDDVIDFLNDLVEKDEHFVRMLVRTRVPCNQAIADHPTVQVGERSESSKLLLGDGAERPYEAGFLGVLNGLFGVDEKDWGFLYMAQEEGTGKVLRFFRGPTNLNDQVEGTDDD